MNPAPIYREYFDDQNCEACGKPLRASHCGVDLTSACCKSDRLTAHYQNGQLTLRCAKCNKFVVAFHIASQFLSLQE